MATDELPIDQTARYRLDDEQRDRVRDCLTKAQMSLLPAVFDRLASDIEASIDHFRSAPLEGTFRDTHDALRVLWKRSHLCKPPVQVLRAEIQKLPREAIEYMGRRARVVIPRLFPGETVGDDIFDPPDPLAAPFLAWAAVADDQKLVKALRVLSADGGRGVKGRSRGGGKRSRARFEPVIMGEARGAGARDHTGGRPAEDARHELVMHLASDWSRATDQAPQAGRGDHAGFADLVHSAFQWLDLSEDPGEAAGYALRRYWAEMKAAKAVPSLQDFLERRRQCFDCKWSENRFENDKIVNSCGRLNVACRSARQFGAACGPSGTLFEFLAFSERGRPDHGSRRGS